MSSIRTYGLKRLGGLWYILRDGQKGCVDNFAMRTKRCIEPSPGEVGWKYKYRYASCGLRFDVINSNETLEGLKKESMSKQEEKIKKIKAMEVVEVIDGSWERKSEMLDHFILILWN